MKLSTKNSLVLSAISFVLCIGLLFGATFAWYTSSEETDVNVIKIGDFDAKVWFHNTYIAADAGNATTSDADPAAGQWVRFRGNTVFDNVTLLPGDSAVRYIKFENNSEFAIKFDLVLPNNTGSEYTTNGAAGSLKVYKAQDVTGETAVADMTLLNTLETIEQTASASAPALILTEVVPANSSAVVAVGIELPVTFDNPEIAGVSELFRLRVIATQYNVVHDTAAVTVTAANANENLNLTVSTVTVEIPAATTDVGDVYNLQVVESGTSTSVETATATISYDITLTKNGTAVTGGDAYTVMLDVGPGKDIESVKHNGAEITTYTYNSTTGILTFTTSSFSPFTVTYRLPDLVISKAGEADVGMSLADFRDSVNAGTSYAGSTVSLQKNIDLDGVAWTPIGTTANPFDGVFDGGNHTISNLTYSGAPSGQMLGLFGEVKGTQNADAMTTASVWSDGTFIEENVAEAKYTAVIKNLKLDGFSIANTSTSGSSRYTGALAGRVDDAYIANITVSDSTISGTKGVGGLVGSLNGSTVKNCKTLSDVTVQSIAGGYNVGGLFGGTNYANHSTATYYGAVIDCENNADVTVPADGATGGYAGGIVGMSQNKVSGSNDNGRCYVFVNCVNKGDVTYGSATAGGVGGIVGSGINAIAFVNCSNSGALTANTVNDGISGIEGFGCGNAVNCTNTGNITASAAKMAGILVDDVANSGGTVITTGCTNSGVLTNSNATGITAQIAVGSVAIFTNQTYASVDDVIAVINGNPSTSAFEFIGCTVTDNSGTLTFGGRSIAVYADSKICSKVDASSAGDALSVNIPGVTVEITSTKAAQKVSSSGDDCTVTVASGVTIGALTVAGDESSATVAGTVGNLTLAGEGDVEVELLAGAAADKVGFGGTGTYVFTNRGTISHTTTSEYSNQHTVSTIKACNITFNNYGTVEAKTGGPNNRCSYAMLFYNGCTVVVNQYPGSTITADQNGYTLACSSAASVIYNTCDAQGTVIDTVVKK